jgi:hypothetical protein
MAAWTWPALALWLTAVGAYAVWLAVTNPNRKDHHR